MNFCAHQIILAPPIFRPSNDPVLFTTGTDLQCTSLCTTTNKELVTFLFLQMMSQNVRIFKIDWLIPSQPAISIKNLKKAMKMTWLHKFFGLFSIPDDSRVKSAQQLILTVLPFHPLYFQWAPTTSPHPTGSYGPVSLTICCRGVIQKLRWQKFWPWSSPSVRCVPAMLTKNCQCVDHLHLPTLFCQRSFWITS